MKKAVYSGTFDPVTYGHISVLKKAANIFDEIVVAVARDNYKNTLFTIDERVELLKKCTKDLPNVTVEGFEGLLVNYAAKIGAQAIIRGLRMVSDFDYEMQMASFNKALDQNIETVFFAASNDYSYLSSSMIRNIASLNGDVSAFVPEAVNKALAEKYSIGGGKGK